MYDQVMKFGSSCGVLGVSIQGGVARTDFLPSIGSPFYSVFFPEVYRHQVGVGIGQGNFSKT